jgi:hypothetical protein
MVRPHSVAEAADLFVSARHPRSTISTSAGIKAIRDFMPACEHTDDELAEIVAALAVRQRRSVIFDSKPI